MSIRIICISIRQDPLGSNMDKMTRNLSFLLNMACKRLTTTVKAFPYKKQLLFVIISFDKVHALEDHYIDFHHALHALLKQPAIFSFLLSTTGHTYNFNNPLAGMVNNGWIIPLFSELGFNHFANYIHISG